MILNKETGDDKEQNLKIQVSIYSNLQDVYGWPTTWRYCNKVGPWYGYSSFLL